LGSAIAKKIDRLSSRQSRHLGVPVGNILAWKWRRCGYDFDATMLRIGSMNMLLHGVESPDIRYRD
jgi:type I restriction-modification system DNA methylase subunit